MAYQPIREPEVEIRQVIEKPLSVEERVSIHFKDIPVMVRIAKCESNFRHWEKGVVLRGYVDPSDTGVMQINKRYHLKASKEMGLDIESLEGNLAYASYLYRQQGTKPWRASELCWGK